MKQPPLLLALSSYGFLAKELLQSGKFEQGSYEKKFFPDGERYLRLVSSVDRREVVLLGGTTSDAATLELYDLGCAIAKNGAARLSLVIPYFGYSTMERASQQGEVVVAKTRARLLSAIPTGDSCTEIYLVDVHSEGLPYYFEGTTVARHLYAKEAIFAALKAEMNTTDFVLGSTDAGRAKWVQSLANEIGVPAAHVLKRRVSGSQTEFVGINADVKGKPVALYDDMIRTGGTLITAAQAYLQAGATSIKAFATHGVLPQDSLKNLQQSGLFSGVACTNSHPRAVELSSDFLHVYSIADILVAGLSSGF